MSLYRAQDQLVAQSLAAKPAVTTWCTCVSSVMTFKGEGTREISKKFAHRSGRPSNLSARLAARLGNPEDRP